MNIAKGLSGIAALGSISAPYIALADSTNTALAAIPIGFAGVIGSMVAYAIAENASERKRYGQRLADMYNTDPEEMEKRIKELSKDEYSVFTHHLDNYDGRSLEELMRPDKEEVEMYAKKNRLPERPDYTINMMA